VDHRAGQRLSRPAERRHGRRRADAQEGPGTGALKTTEQQKVETKAVVQQANPEVVYVPSYNPVVLYGPPVYAYPPIYYPPPPSTGAVVPAGMISFGVGMAIGAAWGCCVAGPVAGLVALKIGRHLRTASPAGRGCSVPAHLLLDSARFSSRG